MVEFWNGTTTVSCAVVPLASTTTAEYVPGQSELNTLLPTSVCPLFIEYWKGLIIQKPALAPSNKTELINN